MAKLEDTTSAYDLSLFAPKNNTAPKQTPAPKTAPHRQKPNKVLVIPQERYAQVRKVRRRGKNRKAVKRIILMVAGAAICLMMIIGQVRLAELTEEIETENQKLTEAESLYTQYQMKSDSQLSRAEVEKYATEKLGMAKAEQNQMEYVELSSNDKGEVIQEEESNWLASGWNYIVGLLS